MSFRTDMATGVASMHVSTSKAFGIQIAYLARQDVIPDLWCLPKSGGDATVTVTVAGRIIEERRVFEIAAQTNFPPTQGLTVDDVITDENGINYRVETWNNSDDIGAVYTFNGLYQKAKQIGAVI